MIQERLPRTVTGVVVRGQQRGRTLGFPTANMQLAAHMAMPPAGVYAGRVTIRTGTYKGQTFITSCSVGYAKTFNATKPTVEPHLLDFDDDIYDETLELTLEHYLRDMIEFDSQEALIEQLYRDVNTTREKYRI